MNEEKPASLKTALLHRRSGLACGSIWEETMSEDKKLQYANCRFPESGFEDVDLSKSTFSNVSLRDARFDNVALTNATFRNACFGSVSIEDANLVGMKINGVLVTDLLSAYAKLARG